VSCDLFNSLCAKVFVEDFISKMEAYFNHVPCH